MTPRNRYTTELILFLVWLRKKRKMLSWRLSPKLLAELDAQIECTELELQRAEGWAAKDVEILK